jgi:DNA-binding transcriptional LysR family regulator
MSSPLVPAPAIPDLRRLHAFVVVAEELHFRRAATRLAMAQSPLSRIIQKLEHDIGAALFVRNRHSVRLTAAGTALLDDARDLLQRANGAVERARSHATASDRISFAAGVDVAEANDA